MGGVELAQARLQIFVEHLKALRLERRIKWRNARIKHLHHQLMESNAALAHYERRCRQLALQINEAEQPSLAYYEQRCRDLALQLATRK